MNQNCNCEYKKMWQMQYRPGGFFLQIPLAHCTKWYHADHTVQLNLSYKFNNYESRL